MSQTLDQKLGTNSAISSGTTLALTTTQAVAVGGHARLKVVWFGAASLPTFTVSGSLTWTTDKSATNSTAYGEAILSAQCPAGLAISTVLTVTWSVTCTERYIIGESFNGTATSAPVTGTPNSHLSSATTWDGGSTTPAVAAMIDGVGITDGGSGTATAGGGNSNPTTGWTEGTEFPVPAAGITIETVYRFDGVASSNYTAGGVFSLSGSATFGLTVAYKDAAGATATPPGPTVVDTAVARASSW